MTSTVAPKVPDGADPHDSSDPGDPRDPRDPRGLRSGAPLLDAWLRATAAGSATSGGDAARMSIPGHKQRPGLTGAVVAGAAGVVAAGAAGVAGIRLFAGDDWRRL